MTGTTASPSPSSMAGLMSDISIRVYCTRQGRSMPTKGDAGTRGRGDGETRPYVLGIEARGTLLPFEHIPLYNAAA